MDTVVIRQAIAAAKAHEQATSQLGCLLHLKVNQLHHSIQLPANNVVPALLNFIIHYVEHVPEFIDAVEAIAEEVGIGEYTEPVMSLAKDFFARPPDLLSGHEGLNALMDESYLSHRLTEEINDRFMACCGQPLVPMDMTRSNLIIHNLIGEPFANQLDQAVHLIVGGLENYEEVFSQASFLNYTNKQKDRWLTELNRWPCLVDNLSVNILLDEGDTPVIVN